VSKNKYKEQLGELWPTGTHPMTGEPFEKFVFMEVDRDVREVRYGPPEKPELSREIWDYDGDEPHYVRDMTDEEYEVAKEEHKKDLQIWRKMTREWRRTGGHMFVPGDTTTRGKFETKSGAWAEGELAPIVGEDTQQWYWRSWGTPGLDRDVSRETIRGD
jgi:hypothetical protein